jgi:3-oxoacyl-[acyl-carrier-protein] synthase II
MGECLTTTTACTSSAQAIGEAYKKIKYGLLDAVICGGSDSMTTPFGLSAFSTLGVISKNNDEYNTACRPFDKTRDGFVIGEGSAMFVLEEYESCKKRGGIPLAEILGYSSTNDAYRLTDEPPDARGSINAIKFALDDAGLNIDEIDYINAHGTGTKMNDKTETFTIKSVFGNRAYNIPVSSTKSMIGHLVAAAGAIELGTSLISMINSIIPPTINYKVKDEECDLDYVTNVSRESKINTVLSNSFGFGGQNACLIIKKI